MASENAEIVSNLVSSSMSEMFEQKSPLRASGNTKYVEQFKPTSYATGGTINIKVPSYPNVQIGLANAIQPLQDFVIPYTITQNDIYSVTRELSVYQEIFNILGGSEALTDKQRGDIVDNYATPAYQAINGAIELTSANRLLTTAYLSPVDSIQALQGVNNFASVSQVNTLANILGYQRERYMIMNEYDAQAVSNSLQNMFNESINKEITETARVGGPDKGHLAGFDVWSSVQLQRFEAGPLNNTDYTNPITVSNISSDGTTLTLTGVTASTAKLIFAGDRISIPTVNLVTNITYQSSNFRLVVTAANDAFGDGAGNVQVTLSYPLMPSGEHQNVNKFPSIGDQVFIFPDRNVNYAYVPSGLCFAPMKLPEIRGAQNSKTSEDSMVPVNAYIQGAVLPFENVFRVSCMVGIRVLAPYVIEFPSLAN